MKLLVFLSLSVLTLSAINLSTDRRPSTACADLLHTKILNSNAVLVEVDKDGNYDTSCSNIQVGSTAAGCLLRASCYNQQKELKDAKVILSKDIAKTCCPST